MTEIELYNKLQNVEGRLKMMSVNIIVHLTEFQRVNLKKKY